MAQDKERKIRAAATTGDGKFGSSGDFSFTGGNVMHVLRKDGFKAIHSFRIFVLRKQKLTGGQIGSDGVRVCTESANKSLAGFLRSVKVDQSLAKQDQGSGITRVLVGVRTKERCGFGRFMLRAKMLRTG
jgi:hypothetical protein